jgi:SNF2 family DNA or RNA helicase
LTFNFAFQGKTVQTIAFLAWLKYRRQSKVIDIDNDNDNDNKSEVNQSLPHLIVVPVSTLPNWIREFEKFCPEMKVFKYHGSQKEREELKENLREHLPKNYNHKLRPQKQLDVIVAPVSYFQKENSPDRKFLSSFKYDYL